MGIDGKTAGLKRALLVAGAVAGAALAPWSAPAEVAPAVVQPAEAPVPIAVAWSAEAIEQLLAAIDGAQAEGLNPSDYSPARLRAAAAAGAGAELDALANASAMALARDYYLGRVGDRSTMDWLIERSPYETAQLASRLNAAVAAGDLAGFYAALLPADPRYAALRAALVDAPDKAARDRLRANMERWRWMPRTLGTNYLYVNMPSYQLRVINDGQPMSTYTVVVGARDTPTPQLATPTSSLVVNPWWNVPQSIVQKSNLRPGRGGYLFKANGDGSYMVRQPPGPRNSLGRIKFNLANDQAIYLHDTPAKALFARDQRALSHGCIRVKDIDQLAAELMGYGGDPAQLDDALAGSGTATLRLPRTWQVYLVYFTVDADEAGTLTAYGDPYGRDAELIARLDGRPLQMASR